MTITRELIAEITDAVLARLELGVSADGVHPTVDQAVKAAAAAQVKVAAMSLADRGRMIEIIRRMCNDRAEEWGREHSSGHGAVSTSGRGVVVRYWRSRSCEGGEQTREAGNSRGSR